MITEENLNKLYQEVIEGKKLTTKELNSYGFNSKDLKKLIDENKLERIKIGLYDFKDSEAICALGKNYLSSKEYEKANLCFKKCYELDKSNITALYQLFVASIKNKNYNETINYYESLIHTKSPYYKPDYNLYIYLLNTITEIPEKHQNYAKNIKLEDVGILTNDKRYKEPIVENKIRKAIINKNFKFALKQLNDSTAKKKENAVYDIVLRTLIIDAIEAEKLSYKEILELVKNKKYPQLINILNEKDKKQNLTMLEKYIIKLSETIINIKENKEISFSNFEPTDNIYEAIQRNNYELALEINKNHRNKYNLDDTNNIMNILLTEVCNLIKEIKNNNQEEKQSIKITDIINSLIQNDIDLSLENIKEYLIQKNKKEYEFLITNLIKISILKKDVTYSNVILVLINLSRNNYQFDASNYIEEFYIALSENKFEEAKVYLNIINNAKKIGRGYDFTEHLENALNQKIENINKKTLSVQEKQSVTKEENKNETEYSVKTTEIKTIQKTKVETRDSEKEFVDSKYQSLVSNKGIVLLKPMTKERRETIYSILDNYKDLESFSIGSSEPKQIVMRYKPYIEEHIDFKKIITEGNNAYTNQDYDKCIECYLQILSFGKPKTFAYAKLGLAYMKKWKLDRAIEYLTVATQLSKENGENFDFTELIDRLKGAPEAETKPTVIMQEKDFQNDLEDHYGIKNFEKLNNLIIEQHQDVDSACEKLNINEEQKTRIKLLYAKLYYSSGEYEIGDSFIDDVEKTKNKSQFVKRELEVIRKNRKFYINREKPDIKKLSLTLKPKK